ncbi:MAG: LysR family transcriptional regulator [Saprospiraceae bacterium]|nr:LysR family transcriptional regulator [Saprospiraceae bacterium]
MNYTFHQLNVFLHVVEHESITKASEALFLSQPAVSIQLKKLQDQFEIPLTEVIGRQLFITDFGKEMAAIFRRILEETTAIKEKVEQHKGLLSGKIKISLVSTGKYVMPYFLNGFVKKYPQVEIAMDVTNKLRVVDTLAKNETDFALVSVPPDDFTVASVTLMKNHLYFVGSKIEAEKLNKKNLKPEDLVGLPLIFREYGSATRMAMDRFISQHNLSVNRTLELVSNEAVKQAVQAGLGFSIMPLIGLRNELRNGDMRMLKMKGLPIVTQWSLVYRKGKSLSPAAKKLIEYLEESKQQVMENHFSWRKEFL